MIKVIDISFSAVNDCDSLATIVNLHMPALAYVDHIKHLVNIQVVKHLNFEGTEIIRGVKYTGFKSKQNFWHIPINTLNYIKTEKPDLIIVQGLIFPIQVALLRMKVKKGTVILVQHHGEKPFTGAKKLLQKIADKFITGYLFTSVDNARKWIDEGIIKSKDKCFELLEASTHFEKHDKALAKRKLNLSGELNFLWVGRLNAGKDPFTIIKAFALFSKDNPAARLFMIYQTEELLPEIHILLSADNNLSDKLILVGRVPHEALEHWFSAADFYVSASHSEGSGYALLEAMACGCIPVVSNIPTFNRLTNAGEFGSVFETGNVADLASKFQRLNQIDREAMSYKISDHFSKNLSFASIAEDLFSICKKLGRK